MVAIIGDGVLGLIGGFASDPYCRSYAMWVTRGQ